MQKYRNNNNVIKRRNDLRNIAIIAHVDHGKTTLVDAMLQQSNVFRENSVVEERVLDSNDLEKERGITILSKNTAITYGDTKINIVDTPGHADFGGEVERVLNMVDGALLLVDAVEGPMPQTRFVLRKALELGLRIVVVINKVDRPAARSEEVLNETFDLFVELGADDEQADFPVIYAIGLTGQAGDNPNALTDNLKPLFDMIVAEVPAPQIEDDDRARLLVTTLAYDTYKGQIAIGRIYSGSLKQGMPLARIPFEGKRVTGRLDYLFQFHNLERIEVDEAHAGDIVAIGGFDPVEISDTIAHPEITEGLPGIRVEAPTVSMTFSVSTSPFSGREGKTGWGTSRRIRQRLMDETRSNVSLRVEEGTSADKFIVSGRGELHLGILIETMRREGYEFEVSKPEVIFIREGGDEDGRLLEPVEEVHVEVADEMVGPVLEMLGERQGQMQDMISENGTSTVKYIVPTRGLLGFRSQFIRATSGMGQMHSIFHGYEPLAGETPERRAGSLVATAHGTVTTYALTEAKQRGTFFIEPGHDVYEGMVVGEHIRPGDLPLNITKKKHLDNFRSKPKEDSTSVTPMRRMSLDDFIEFMDGDELLEVTPQTLRLRKRELDTTIRVREDKRRRQLVQS
ncbi:MAG: translational GTPase TypA [Aggregatilineales bacterium]